MQNNHHIKSNRLFFVAQGLPLPKCRELFKGNFDILLAGSFFSQKMLWVHVPEIFGRGRTSDKKHSLIGYFGTDPDPR